MTTLHVTVDGAGPPLATIHGGLGLDQTYLLRGLAPLAARYTLLHVDLAGHGGSPPPEDWATQNLEVWADDLDEVRAARGLERWSVLGHSYGAFIAQVYAARDPERVERLVLVAAGPSFAHAPGVLGTLDRRGQPEAARALIDALTAPARDDAELGAGWPKVLPLYFHAWHPRHLPAFAGTRFSAAGFNRGNEVLAGVDLTPRLAAMRAPTLVVSGDDDFIMPADGPGAALVAAIPGARHVIIPDAGHFPFLEAPAVTCGVIADFLAGV